MLTKSDLSQIGKVVEKQIEQQVGPIVETKLKPIKSQIKKIQKTLDLTIRTFDRDHLDLEKHFKSHTIHPPMSSI